MFNLFETVTDDINYLIESAGVDVTVNGISRKAIITNNPIGEFEDKNIHSTQLIKRGDVINYIDSNYLIISESVTQRNGKYKALMRHCNTKIEIIVIELIDTGEVDYRGAPIYEEVETTIPVPAIVDSRTFSVDTNQAINLVNNQITVTVQDNEQTRGIAINDTFIVNGKNRKLVNVDYTKNGLLILYCDLSV
ncbi:hypothetical protein P9274_01060 [Schinkia azotoformans]|uniref:hypothetical protein n=1 Tax=Schinkia azotoformans TaxID=1454 RepID=UPI002E1B6BDD|nr:hypothetical protein [Schinkia azotoformans]